MNAPASFFKRALKSALSTFVTQTKVTAIEKLSDHFLMIEISGSKLKKAKWLPGGKVQVDVAQLTFRTYTPLNVDTTNGKLGLLCYRREDSSAGHWLKALKVGDSCEIFGPRDSLDFSGLQGEVAFFGDETSFAAAKLLQGLLAKRAHLFFEVNSPTESTKVLQHIGVAPQLLVERSSSESQLQDLAKGLVELHAKNNLSVIFLTGRASSIQRIRSLLKENALPNALLKNRAYWADGKAGLD